MGALHGRQRWLFSPHPAYDRVNAVWSGLLGTLAVGLGVVYAWPLLVLAPLMLGLAAWSWKRASWTKAHPEVRTRVTKRNDARLTRHPRRSAAIAALLFGLIAATQLYRYTLGSRGNGQAPPAWAWVAAVAAGVAVGLVVFRLRLRRARRRQAGTDPYPGQPEYQDSYGTPTQPS